MALKRNKKVVWFGVPPETEDVERLRGLSGIGPFTFEVFGMALSKSDFSSYFKQAVLDASAVIFRATHCVDVITPEMLKLAARPLCLISVSRGLDRFDELLQRSPPAGISVLNCEGNAHSVASLVVTVAADLERPMRLADREMSLGRYNNGVFSETRSLEGSSWMILGTGRIAKDIIPFLTPYKAAGCLAYHPDIEKARRFASTFVEGVPVSGVDSYLAHLHLVDFIVLALPSTAETEGIVNDVFLGRLKPNACLINVARAEVVDEGAVARAILERRVRYATDVHFPAVEAGKNFRSCELGRLHGEECNHPYLLATPHIGGTTVQALKAMTKHAVDQCMNFLLESSTE